MRASAGRPAIGPEIPPASLRCPSESPSRKAPPILRAAADNRKRPISLPPASPKDRSPSNEGRMAQAAPGVLTITREASRSRVTSFLRPLIRQMFLLPGKRRRRDETLAGGLLLRRRRSSARRRPPSNGQPFDASRRQPEFSGPDVRARALLVIDDQDRAVLQLDHRRISADEIVDRDVVAPIGPLVVRIMKRGLRQPMGQDDGPVLRPQRDRDNGRESRAAWRRSTSGRRPWRSKSTCWSTVRARRPEATRLSAG